VGRIRTIKPEFPQSESMDRVSREARLLFVLLWTVADDAGRLRTAPRLLAGQRILVLAHRREIIDQTISKLRDNRQGRRSRDLGRPLKAGGLGARAGACNTAGVP
jgi:hypothetical protein